MDLAYKQEATVGTLVILAFVLFFVGTTWLSGRSVGTDSDDFYKIEFRDASNLKASSVVRIVDCAVTNTWRRVACSDCACTTSIGAIVPISTRV